MGVLNFNSMTNNFDSTKNESDRRLSVSLNISKNNLLCIYIDISNMASLG